MLAQASATVSQVVALNPGQNPAGRPKVCTRRSGAMELGVAARERKRARSDLRKGVAGIEKPVAPFSRGIWPNK